MVSRSISIPARRAPLTGWTWCGRTERGSTSSRSRSSRPARRPRRSIGRRVRRKRARWQGIGSGWNPLDSGRGRAPPVECLPLSRPTTTSVPLRGADPIEATTPRIRCVGCGGLVPEMNGPTHRYLESSPGCWNLYGLVLAREYSDPAFAALHRLTVDSYAVQHPGRPSAQTTQSVCLHLISLHLVLERGLSGEYATRVMGEAARKKARFSWLEPPSTLGVVTVRDLAGLDTPPQHEAGVRAWAESAWSAWAEHHETVRRWVPA